MIMSNEEKDKLIKDTIAKDNYVFSGNDAYSEIIRTEIANSKIKPSKFTNFQKNMIIVILFILLIISIIINILYFSGMEISLSKESAEIVKPYVIEDNLSTEDDIENKLEENTAKDSSQNTTQTKIQNTNIQNLVVTEIENNDNNSADDEQAKKDYSEQIDEEKLKQELKTYALSIGRFEDIIDTKEENTILLVMAQNILESLRAENTNKSNIGKYALTRENADVFIEEFTGSRPSDILQTYSNYIGYMQSSKSYNWGKDGNPFASEKYEVLSLEFSGKNNSGFKVSGIIEKDYNGNKCNYHFNATISVNKEDFVYVPYTIKSFTYSIANNSVDDVFRLVDKTEEVDPKAKK